MGRAGGILGKESGRTQRKDTWTGRWRPDSQASALDFIRPLFWLPCLPSSRDAEESFLSLQPALPQSWLLLVSILLLPVGFFPRRPSPSCHTVSLVHCFSAALRTESPGGWRPLPSPGLPRMLRRESERRPGFLSQLCRPPLWGPRPSLPCSQSQRTGPGGALSFHGC